MTDPLLRMLANLPQADPDRARADRVRTRCHAALARGRKRHAPRPSGRARIREALLVGLGSVYLLETVRHALRLFGIG